MLELRYLDDFQLIQVTLTDRLELWPTIRFIFEENAEEILSIGPNTIRLPVWAFLSCRKPLVYELKKFQLEFEADLRVQEFLKKANTHEEDYKKVTSLPTILLDDLIKKLSAEGFCRTLTNHQKRNVLQLAALPSGATFSVPGAGKTTEALAYYYFKKNENNRLLVVAPKNAFSAWEEQVSLCLRQHVNVIRLVGGENSIKSALRSNPDVLLITYQQLPLVKNIIANFLLLHPTFMFLDESHRIKRGIGGQWASTILSLSHLPVSKLIMSGTPLPNGITDLLPQFNFIYPEMDADEENVKELIKPVFVRTTKGELRLPEVKRIETLIQFKPNQRNLYELIRSEEARSLVKISAKDRTKLRRVGKSVMRLLQLVSNPALLAKSDIDWPEELYDALIDGDGPKIEYACYRARVLAQQGYKSIIWSNFVENVEIIALRLADIGADYIHGGVEAGSEEENNTRESKIARFHKDPNAFVLVANPAACSEGISLHTVCHYAIYIDRNYNAAQFLQSEDRIHRLGLPPNTMTTIELLHTPDTIDDSVKRRLTSKVKKMADVLEDHSLNIETVEPDLESDGIDMDDINDFMNHLFRI